MRCALQRLDAHFAPYEPYFRSATRSVAEQGKRYLHGLYQCPRANIEKMAETVAHTDYQRLHHMLSESPLDLLGIRRQLIADANASFGHGGSALVIDESGFAKKGEHSAGVARQWNGRLGKTDNCQVGVFAAITRGGRAALVDAELYLPQAWVQDAPRCKQAGIPEAARVLRSKARIGLEMIGRARAAGLHFDWVAFDGGYGHLPWMLLALDDASESFLAEVHANQRIYLEDPCPAIPERRSAKGRAPSKPVAHTPAQTVTDWAAMQPASAWRRMKLRDGEKGELLAEYLSARIYVWDGHAPRARHWHLLVRREIGADQLKFCLSNAAPEVCLRQLVTMQAARHFVERAFEDAKGACGMADYQVRRWDAWHHHMALVMIALMFLAKERSARHHTHRLLSCQDIVDILSWQLPSKITTEADLVQLIAERHRRRQLAMTSRYRKQGLAPPASCFGGI